MVDENSNMPPYSSENHTSCYQPGVKKTLNCLINEEIRGGKLSIVNQRPNCVHAIGAIVKEDKSIRPITDCKRPLETSVNSYTTNVSGVVRR